MFYQSNLIHGFLGLFNRIAGITGSKDDWNLIETVLNDNIASLLSPQLVVFVVVVV